MDRTYRQILKHAGIFGAGAILSRMASIVLLPLYTRYLHPADYGVTALLDLTINLMSLVAGGGIATAATRAHFDERRNVTLDAIWWTAIIVALVTTTIVLAPAVLFRKTLANAIFGSELIDGAYYLTLGITTLWIGSFGWVADAFFRARKASSFVVILSLIRLVLNIFLNLTFIVGFHMGVAGVLWGNLLSAGFTATVQLAVFLKAHLRIAFSGTLAESYYRFGAPLVIFGLCSAAMHEADRYVLRVYQDLGDVGLYSVAYQIGQGVNTLIVTPFVSIWGVMIYEIAREPDAKTTYARVFKHFVYGLSLILFATALFAEPILRVLTPPEYLGAARIIPIVCLAYLLFSVHEHFKIPALLAGRTIALLPAVMAAAVSNIALNFLFIPRFGAFGAAWVSVATFVIFSSIGLARNRAIERYPYPFAACALAVVGMVVSFVAYRLAANHLGERSQIALAFTMWLGWCLILLGGSFRTVLADLQTSKNTRVARVDTGEGKSTPSQVQ